MNIEILSVNNVNIIELKSEKEEFKTTQDFLDIVGTCMFNDAYKVIIHEDNITPNFFDLSTKLAGEVLQKFTIYNIELAIIGDFSKYNSQSLKDFIYESNKHKKVNFLSSLDEAKLILSKM